MSSSTKCWCGCSLSINDNNDNNIKKSNLTSANNNNECNECIGDVDIKHNESNENTMKRKRQHYHEVKTKTDDIETDHLALSPKQSSRVNKRIRLDKHYNGFDSYLTLERLRIELQKFANERDWNQFHTPRNLLIAMYGELGELSELFQWEGETDTSKWSADKKKHLGEELSDVLLYLLRLADKCQVDLSSAVVDKMKKNALKYPVHKARGRSDKYTAYH